MSRFKYCQRIPGVPSDGLVVRDAVVYEEHLDDVVYLDSVTHGLYLEVPSEVETYNVNFTGLKDAALAPDQTSRLITEIADNLNR